MRERILPAIKESPEDYDAIEKAIRELFLKEIYRPLVKELGLNSKVLTNTIDDLIEAILKGHIWFERGTFSGKFSAAISKQLYKMGAKFNRKQGGFKIRASELPQEIKDAVSQSVARFDQTLKKIDQRLEKMLPEEIAEKVKLKDQFDTTLWRVNKKFEKSVQGIIVAPKLSKEARQKIAAEYTENLKLYIKDWTKEEILELRKRVQTKAFRGVRYEDLVKTIQKSYQVSLNKAKFLARQETSLMMSKFREVRYREAGVDEYIWGCVAGSANHPVRPMHKALEGKKFSFNNPPIVNEKGERKNPGEDYNCRCFPKPVVKF